jgi:ABC-2 type transport system ATP-binding protein
MLAADCSGAQGGPAETTLDSEFIMCRNQRTMNRDASGIAQPAVRATGLVKTFGTIRAVDDVTFDLAPGRIYGVLGPNGSGKTTLIRLLTGLTRATSGHAEVLGVPMPSRTTLGRIGYMTQSDGVYPALTVGENVRFFAATYGVAGSDAVIEALRLVDLVDRIDSITGTLSGGQRRRLSLACALVHKPPILFLDEPTVGVDPLLRVEFWAHFRALADGGGTIAVSSHVMDEADRCDELLFIRSGKVIARGTGREVRTQAGTDDLEQAFLRLGGDVATTR